MNSSPSDTIFWKVGDPLPEELHCRSPLSYTAVPKCCCWFSSSSSSSEKDDDVAVALVEGYNLASHIPPTFMLSSRKLNESMLKSLKEKKLCTLSIATTREQHCLGKVAAAKDGESPKALTFGELNLIPSGCNKDLPVSYPPAVMSSPVKMYCRLVDVVEISKNNELILLEAKIVVISKEILSEPTNNTSSGRKIYAKVDAELMRPVGSLGDGRFVELERLHSMERPKKSGAAEDDHQGLADAWESDPFALVPASRGPGGSFKDLVYTYRNDTSNLGYNPMKALILPRPIGWVSSYRDDNEVGDSSCRIAHVAPYSFFTDLGKGYVAFSSYRRNYDSDDSKKDAQTNAEKAKCFATNVVTEELSVRMNYTSAPLERHESEFEASPGLQHKPSFLVDAPLVQGCPIVTECRYLKTVDVASFSIVIGQVVAMHLNKRMLTDDSGRIDPAMLRPVTRLGYTDEYGVASRLLATEKNPSQSSNENVAETTTVSGEGSAPRAETVQA